MKVCITIPAYNEEETIGLLIKDIHQVMRKTKYKYEVIVVDDGSNDNTASISKKAGAKVFSHPNNYGLAETFRTEVKKCLELKADVIVHIDADRQYRAKDILRLLKEIENGYDLVIGDRFLGGVQDMPLVKKWGNKAFSRVISKIVRMKIGDAQSGFRAFTKEVAMGVKISSPHTYTQEQIIRAVREKFKVKQIPTPFRARDGKSRLISNPFEYAFKAWINILRIYRDYKPLKFFGLFGGFLFSIGFLIGLYFFIVWFLNKFITRIPSLPGIGEHQSLLFLMLILLFTGLQIILFGFSADMKK